MPTAYRRHTNDNVRTEHLKCPGCRTQIHLQKIEAGHDGREVRSFVCPHCSGVSKLVMRQACDEMIVRPASELAR